MKKVLLVGCGAEIGAMLLGMSDPERDGFRISVVLTNPISDDPKNPGMGAFESLYTRLVMADSLLLDAVQINRDQSRLIIRGNPISVHFGDSVTFDLQQLHDTFDLCILATSKKQIGNQDIIRRFLTVAEFVIGVSEAAHIPALYANLIGVPETFLPNPPRLIGADRVFCVGSCQSNGWQAPLRALLEVAEERFSRFEMAGMELDIVHPDTPTGRLGTKSLEARSQDPRNNFRPSFSQVEMAMKLLFPASRNIQTVSLRTLTMPPGYQISRFFFRYATRDGGRMTTDAFRSSFRATAARLPDTIRMQDIPFGSRAFERCNTAAIVLTGDHYFTFCDNPFGMADDQVSELIAQSYVHNVRGYCRSVLNIVRHLVGDSGQKAFYE